MCCVTIVDMTGHFATKEGFGTVKRTYASESVLLMHATGGEAFSFSRGGSYKVNTNYWKRTVGRDRLQVDRISQAAEAWFVLPRQFESDGTSYYRNKCLRAVAEGVKGAQE